MAFKPQPNQYYYIIPKSSPDLLLASQGDNLGAHIQQLKYDKFSNRQSFRFDPWKDKFFLSLNGDHYVAVHDSSTLDNTPVIHWKWEQEQWSIRFQILPAGNGYYRIMAMHSRSFLEIKNSALTERTDLVQSKLSTKDNQLFSIVPTPEQTLAASHVSFYQQSEMIRTAALGLIGLIPEVGAGLAFIVDIFWEENDKFADFWEQMKVYVDARVRALILTNELNKMGKELQGIVNSVQQISQAPQFEGLLLLNKVQAIVSLEHKYMSATQGVLPYLVGLGNIQLALRRTLYIDYPSLFGDWAKDITVGQLRANLIKSGSKEDLRHVKNIDTYFDDLKKAIDLYEKNLSLGLENGIEQRLKQIKFETGPLLNLTNGEAFTSKAYDEYDGWTQGWTANMVGRNVHGIKDHKERAEFAYNQRRKKIELQYRAQMADFLNSASLWKYFNPTVPLPKPITHHVALGIYGGLAAYNRFNYKAGQTITAIDIYLKVNDPAPGLISPHENLCGINISYDGLKSGIMGYDGKGTTARSLTLQKANNPKDDEYFISVYGYEGDDIWGLWFVTNRGRVVGGGIESSIMFYADLSDGLNARLEGISGANNVDRLQQLTFHWQYTESFTVPNK